MRCPLLVIALVVVACPVSLFAAEPETKVQKTFEKMLKAIIDNDREAFTSEGTAAVKEGTTKEIMDALHEQLGGRLKEGYRATYLCKLKQVGHEIHLWKLAFKDQGDDFVVRIAMKEGKVGGFFLQ